MAIEILETLRKLGVTVQVIPPDRLRLQPSSVIPPQLLARVREAKPQIIAALSKHPSRVPAECWHCSGQKACSCIACREPHANGPAACVVCNGNGVMLQWVN